MALVPPYVAARSSRITLAPARAASSAAHPPAMPKPITMTSVSSVSAGSVAAATTSRSSVVMGEGYAETRTSSRREAPRPGVKVRLARTSRRVGSWRPQVLFRGDHPVDPDDLALLADHLDHELSALDRAEVLDRD